MEINALFDLWDKFAEKMKNYSDYLGEPFYHFPAGTPCIEVIEWFGQQNPFFLIVEHGNPDEEEHQFSVVRVPANAQEDSSNGNPEPPKLA